MEDGASLVHGHPDLRIGAKCNLKFAQRKETSQNHEDIQSSWNRKWLWELVLQAEGDVFVHNSNCHFPVVSLEGLS